MTKVVSYVQIDVPQCSLTYGTPPCTASLVSSPPTGTIKCFNSLGTCQDKANFTDVPITLTFGEDVRFDKTDAENPVADIYPLIKTIQIEPSIVSLGEDMGQRATITITFRDAKHSDPGPDWDKYSGERTYSDPFNRGTFWGKFRARNPFLRGRNLRLYRGVLGDPLDAMDIHHFVIESIDGPAPNGDFKIIAKDVLKLADGDRSQAPTLSNGFLNADITNADTTLTLSPTGIGAEYPDAGYAAIGGSEIVSYSLDPTAGNDANCKLLLHFDGATVTDSSSAAHGTGTLVNNAQTSTSNVKFGTRSLLMDGTGDSLTFPDSADWQLGGGTGAFTIEVQARCTSLADDRVFFGQEVDANNRWRWSSSTTGVVTFSVVNAGSTIITMSTAAGALTADSTYHHWAVVRSGNVFTMYKNGVSVATTTDADSIPDFASALEIGSDTGAGDSWAGNLDELRISNVARWTTAFTPPSAAYQTSANTVAITRAQLNTEAIEHSAQDRFQVVLSYDSQDPADIIYDLLTTYAAVDPSFINLSEWQTETDTYLGVVSTLHITEPTSVAELVAELIETFGLAIWWDDQAQQIRFQVLRAISSSAQRFNEDNTLEDTLKVREQPEKRISRVNVYFAQINPLLNKTETSNYRSTANVIDEQSELDEGSAAIKTIFARAIGDGGRSVAERSGNKYLNRYVRPPRRFNFDLMRFAETDPSLGGGAILGGGTVLNNSWPFQDETGDRAEIPIQITRVSPQHDRYQVEAEEMLFEQFDEAIDPNTHTIILDADQNNVNLEELHDDLYPVATSGQTVLCYINSGVIIGSTSTSSPAFTVGSFAAGVTVNVIVNGRVQGRGGDGRDNVLTTGGSGFPGGTAFYTRETITLTLNEGDGEIWGGGGGGGSSQAVGGSGGAGTNPGLGGTGSGEPNNGNDGTSEAGGAEVVGAGGFQRGGEGGNPGQAGGTGNLSGGGTTSGGAAGTAIDGVSFCTKVGTGDILGAQVN